MARQNIPGVIYRPAAEVARFLEAGAWHPLTAGDAVRHAAERAPDKPYLSYKAEHISFRRFDERTEILAAGLLAEGLRPGDRALFQMGTVPETLLALVGCFKAGIVPVCTLPQHREIEIGRIAQLSRARSLIVQADASPAFDLVSFARRMRDESETLETVVVARGPAPADCLSLEALERHCDVAAARAAVAAAVTLEPDDVLIFQLSGGSTGIPKIIPRFHGDYLGQAEGWATRHQMSDREIFLWSLPIIHNAAMLVLVVPALLRTATILLQERFDVGSFREAVRQDGVTYGVSIGPLAPRLIDCRDIGPDEFHSLRLFVTIARADDLEAHLGLPCVNLYGITEGVLMAAGPDDPVLPRTTSNGRPTSALDEIRLLRPDGEEEVAPGDPGELCFRGPYRLAGYYDAPEIDAVSFTSDGFFRTGDMMRAERHGDRTYYFFLGRLKDNISRGGEKFGAEEVEDLIVRHPAVLDARLVAMPDRYLGERACAYIIPRPGLPCPTVPGLGTFLLGLGLAKYKLPERVETIDAFPVTRVGKIDKAALRQAIAALVAAETAQAG